MKLLLLFLVFSARAQSVDDEIVRDLEFYQNFEVISEAQQVPLELMEAPIPISQENLAKKNDESPLHLELLP